MKFPLFLALICCVHHAQGAFERPAQGSEIIAFGGTSVALVDNGWAAVLNPGGLATLEQGRLSLFYVPEQYGLRELARVSFSFVEPTPMGNFALSGSRFGFELYRELSVSMSYAAHVTEAFHIGVNVAWYGVSIKNYGSQKCLGVDLGILVDLTQDIHWGFAATNLNSPTIGRGEEKLPQLFSFGVSYQSLDHVLLALDVLKDIRYPTELHLGIKYTVLDLLDILGGAASDPSIVTAGIGLHLSGLRLSYSCMRHPELGMTHSFSVSLDTGTL
jgi:hypothetical protein